jgi:hypothetical protein
VSGAVGAATWRAGLRAGRVGASCSGVGDRLFERMGVGAALFFSRKDAKTPRGWGVADDRRDAEVGWGSRSDADGLGVGDVEG